MLCFNKYLEYKKHCILFYFNIMSHHVEYVGEHAVILGFSWKHTYETHCTEALSQTAIDALCKQ